MKLYYCQNCGKLHFKHECNILTEKTTLSNDTCYNVCIDEHSCLVCPSCSERDIQELNYHDYATLCYDTVSEFINAHYFAVNIKATIDDGEQEETKEIELAELVTYELSGYYFDFLNLAFEGDTLYIEMDIIKG